MNLLKFFLFLILCSCNTKTNTDEPVAQEYSDEITVETNDTILVKKCVKEFIIWYRDNYKNVNNVRFVLQDSLGNYQVDIGAGDTYLERLRSSGYLSKSYVEVWSKYFSSRAEYFRDNPQNEGPPEGFEFDLVFITQEPELIWQQVEKMKLDISFPEPGKAIATTIELAYDFELSLEDGQWKIDYIATMNYD